MNNCSLKEYCAIGDDCTGYPNESKLNYCFDACKEELRKEVFEIESKDRRQGKNHKKGN